MFCTYYTCVKTFLNTVFKRFFIFLNKDHHFINIITFFEGLHHMTFNNLNLPGLEVNIVISSDILRNLLILIHRFG